MNQTRLLELQLERFNVKFELEQDEFFEADDCINLNERYHIQIADYCNKPYILNEYNEKEGWVQQLGEYGINEICLLINRVKKLI